MTLNTKSPFFPVKYSRPFDSLKPNIPLNLGGHFPQNCGSCSMNTKAFHSLAFTSADPLTRDIEVLNTLMIEKAILPILKKKKQNNLSAESCHIQAQLVLGQESVSSPTAIHEQAHKCAKRNTMALYSPFLDLMSPWATHVIQVTSLIPALRLQSSDAPLCLWGSPSQQVFKQAPQRQGQWPRQADSQGRNGPPRHSYS